MSFEVGSSPGLAISSATAFMGLSSTGNSQLPVKRGSGSGNDQWFVMNCATSGVWDVEFYGFHPVVSTKCPSLCL